MEALKSGDRLGRYRLDRPLGAGGMGSVWVAVQEGLGRRVALKVMHPAFAADPVVASRFRREAEIAASFNHPGIVPVTDFGVHEGRAYLVMDLLEGESIDSLLAREGRLSAERVAFLATQILSALEAAHAKDVVHRDLKPDNVFVTSSSGVQDVARLLDFGIASLTEATGDAKMTSTGQVLGTPTYMAPEQAKGLPVEARSDLYSVGVIMYEALTGQVPFSGTNYHQLMFAIVDETPTPLAELRPDLDPSFVAVVERAMAKKAEDRFADAAAMRAAIAPFARSVPITLVRSAPGAAAAQANPTPNTDPLAATMASGDQLTPVATAVPGDGASARSKVPFMLLGAIAALALVAVGGFIALRSGPPEPPDRVNQALVPTASGPLVAEAPTGPTPADRVNPSDPEPTNAVDPTTAVEPANALEPSSPRNTLEPNPSEPRASADGEDSSGETNREEEHESNDAAEATSTMRTRHRTGAPPSASHQQPTSTTAQRSGQVIVPCGHDGAPHEMYVVVPGSHDVQRSGSTSNNRVQPNSAFRERLGALTPELTRCYAHQPMLQGQSIIMELDDEGRVSQARMHKFCPVPASIEQCVLGVMRTLNFSDLEHHAGEVRASYGVAHYN